MSSIAFFLSLGAAGFAAQTDPAAPPELKTAPACVCPAPSEAPDVTFSGYVVDAKITLGADRRSVKDRMATIFDVKSSSDGDIEGRTSLWHTTSAETCGVSFDYGKKYSVAARWSDGELETDKCLMREME
ncbi:hypothetical protein [Hyphococcus sp.]|uniref:hypothetical protein n=1 Tax=Hyphococcus sp. TaxID=2038636 RepID=UPI003CCB8FFF